VADSEYREFTPSGKLKNYVKCFWYLQKGVPSGTDRTERVYPAGCVEVLFHFGARYKSARVGDNDLKLNPKYYIFGQTTGPYEIHQTGQVAVIGCRFHPWGAFPFFDFSVRRLSEQRSHVGWLFGRDAEALTKGMARAKSAEEAITLLQHSLLSKIDRHVPEAECLKRLIQRIYDAGGNIRSTDIASKPRMSTRQLERIFNARIGLSPHAFVRIVRFQNFLNKKISCPEHTLTHFAYECGYADQAHLCREFKRFTGLTPTEYFADPEYVNASHRYLAMRMY